MRNVKLKPDLLEAAENIVAELDARYDGAPDSPTLWMGRHIDELHAAIGRAKAWQIQQYDMQRCRPMGGAI